LALGTCEATDSDREAGRSLCLPFSFDGCLNAWSRHFFTPELFHNLTNIFVKFTIGNLSGGHRESALLGGVSINTRTLCCKKSQIQQWKHNAAL
jgi:hypothetical protein